MEIANLFVSVLTPILVALFGWHLANIAKTRDKKASMIQRRMQLAEEILNLMVRSTEITGKVILSRYRLEAGLGQASLNLPTLSGASTETDFSESMKLFGEIQASLREIAISALIFVNPEVSELILKHIQSLLGLVANPLPESNETRIKYQELSTKIAAGSTNLDDLGREIIAVDIDAIQPVQVATDSSVKEIANALKRAIS